MDRKIQSQLSDSRPRRLATGGGSRKVIEGIEQFFSPAISPDFSLVSSRNRQPGKDVCRRRPSFWRREIEIYSALCHQVRGWSSSSRGPSRQRKDHSAGACFLNSS